MKILFIVSLPYIKLFTEKDAVKNAKDLRKKTKFLSRKWRKFEKPILGKIEKYSGFRWKEKIQKVYILNEFPYSGISDPLTIRIDKKTRFVESMIHELIHMNFPEKFKFLSIKSKNPMTFTHIAVYLIYNRIMSELFPQKDPYSEIELNKYRVEIQNAKELDQLWRNSKKNIYDFMKFCLKNKYVR